MSKSNHHPVVCFGEVLWDILPGGRVPGGAPVNVAYHLKKLGKNPCLITRVGDDKDGRDLMEVFSSLEVCTDFFQTDHQYETGKVFGRPNATGEMMYDIVSPSAWDYIGWDDTLEELVRKSNYFVFGSLACRNPNSRDTLFRLLKVAACRVLDINLRAPFYDIRIITELLQQCDILKINMHELELITDWLSGCKDIEGRIRFLEERFNIQTIVLTMGVNGALLHAKGKSYSHPGYTVELADTVGAGDAFLAGFLKELLSGHSYDSALESASVMGAFVASKTGACPLYNLNDIKNFTHSQNSLHSII